MVASMTSNHRVVLRAPLDGVPRAEDFELREGPLPAAGPGEVKIAVDACGINFPDYLMVVGKYQMRPPRPFAGRP